MEEEEKERINEEERKLRLIRIRESIMKITGIISLSGFLISGIFLANITGAAIGTERENLAGFLVILIICFVWTSAVILSSGKNKQELNIKELINQAQREQNEK